MLKYLEEIMNKYDGNFSVLYPFIKEELKEYLLKPQDLPFPYEFICFEYDYLQYIIHMMKNNIPIKEVVDIGCQYGFQSYYFNLVDYHYIGIEPCIDPQLLFRNNKNLYLPEFFPNTSVDIKNKVVISNMSLGYFNNDSINDEIILDKLKECNYLYIATTPELNKKLEKIFTHKEIINDSHKAFIRMFYSK